MMNTVNKVFNGKISEKEHLSNLLSIAQHNGQSVALWRLPDKTTRHLILSSQAQQLPSDPSIEDLPAGFIFSAFDRTKNSLFLEADYIFSFENKALRDPANTKENTSLLWLSEQVKHVEIKPFIINRTLADHEEKDSTAFQTLVKECIERIGNGAFEKVVPSRVKKVILKDDFDIIAAYDKLCEMHPGAFVSFVHIPGKGTWMGASPEVLVTVEDKTIFKTVALAGTQPFDASKDIKSVAWTQKEIEEQALVERYIISCFKKIRLREYEEHGPKTVVAGNLMHLKSDFRVDMVETNFPQLGSVMLQLLHPTSAVCGMPMESASEFLKSAEGYDREFYAGYLGPVNHENDIHIFVNLRCFQLTDEFAVFYSGAGVIQDSVPEKEWMETEIKLNNLINVVI